MVVASMENAFVAILVAVVAVMADVSMIEVVVVVWGIGSDMHRSSGGHDVSSIKVLLLW
jgi:hypothetical protein